MAGAANCAESPLLMMPALEQERATQELLWLVCGRYNLHTMEFEFDPEKSEKNKKRHGIDFYEAQMLWDDPDLIEIPARTADEPRFLVVGEISGKHWSGIITYRDTRVRIISVRRSRKEEIDIYEG
jgi:hypothetical protein